MKITMQPKKNRQQQQQQVTTNRRRWRRRNVMQQTHIKKREKKQRTEAQREEMKKRTNKKNTQTMDQSIILIGLKNEHSYKWLKSSVQKNFSFSLVQRSWIFNKYSPILERDVNTLICSLRSILQVLSNLCAEKRSRTHSNMSATESQFKYVRKSKEFRLFSG